MAEECSVCNQLIEPSKETWSENSCGIHYAHTACVRINDTNHCCKKCDPDLFEEEEVVSIEPIEAKEDSVEEVTLEEVSPPIRLPRVGLFSSIKRLTTKLSRDTLETSDDPFFLVSNRCPVDTLLKKKKLRLHNLVNEHGVSLDDFVKAKYTFEELKKFPEISDVECGLDSLIGMGLTYDNLYSYRRQIPVKQLVDHYKISAQDIMGRLHYKFRVPEEGGYPARYLVRYGFTMEKLMKCGLEHKWQLDALELSSSQYYDLEVNPELVDKLESPTSSQRHTRVLVFDSLPDKCDDASQRNTVDLARPKGRGHRAKKIQAEAKGDLGYVRVIGDAKPKAEHVSMVFPEDTLRKKKSAKDKSGLK